MNRSLPDDAARVFLARHGQQGARLVPLSGDASPRRYWRLAGAGLLLMEDRADPEGFAAYLRVARHLNALGLSAPEVAAADPGECLALIEDWGDATYANRLAAGASEEALYALAVDALLHLHHHPDGARIDRPLFDGPRLLRELREVFCDWLVPALEPGIDRDRFNARFLALWQEALAPVADRHEALVLRDFHIDNLLELDGRAGVRRCGLLDFQDAVLGCAEYDLVSLLQDARRDLAPGLEGRMLARYIAGAPAHLGGAAAIRARYHLLGAQRHARICGVFIRLCLRDGKPGYLKWLPRVLGQFETALAAAGLVEIERFLGRELPDWRRRTEALARELAARAGRPE